MNMPFWLLEGNWRGLGVTSVREYEKTVCEYNSGHIFSKPLTNLNVSLSSKNINDFIWTWDSHLLIQDKTLTLLAREGFIGRLYKPDVIEESRLSLPDILLTPGSGDILGVRMERPGQLYTFSPVGILKNKVPSKYRSAKRLRVRLEQLGEPTSSNYRIVSYEVVK